MTENNQEPEANVAGADADIGRLLRAAGRRVEPPEALERDVKSAVQRDWRAFVQERRHSRRRRMTRFAVAAGFAVAAVALWFGRTAFIETPHETFATVRRAVGEVQLNGSSEFSSRRTLLAGQTLAPGDELVTGPAATAAIELESGVAIRLDADTRIAFAEGRLVLGTGAVYVDSATPTPTLTLPRQRGRGQELPIETPFGVVRHLGTQYEVRLLDDGLRVSVREGRVETTVRDGNRHSAQAGERLRVSAAGRVETEAVSRYGPEWDWIGRAAPPFPIDRRPLLEFLNWTERELGREIVFASPASEAEARRVVLRGDAVDLPPQAALTAVLSTTRLKSIDRHGQILIELDR